MQEVALKELDVKDFKSDVSPIWCPGCGDYSVLNALYKAFGIIGLRPDEIVIVSGIGCSSRLPVFVNCYGFHSVHGRTLPIATGIKIANPKLTVIATGGDGDGLAIGAAHFPHAIRRNVDITYIMMDNEIYGLTKGQSSPTTLPGFSSKSSPYGTFEENLNPVGLALGYNCPFVARAYSGNQNQMVDIFVRAIRHKGFSFVHVLSPCVSFNNTFQYFNVKVKIIDKSYDTKDKQKAIQLWQTPGVIYTGVFYEEEKSDLNARISNVIKQAKVDSPSYSIEKLFEEYR